jgi:hypothetical protein
VSHIRFPNSLDEYLRIARMSAGDTILHQSRLPNNCNPTTPVNKGPHAPHHTDSLGLAVRICVARVLLYDERALGHDL